MMMASKKHAKDARMESLPLTMEVEIVDGESVTRYTIPAPQEAFIEEFNKLTKGSGKFARRPVEQ